MDEAYRCPYDGLRMTKIGWETSGVFYFELFECPECQHRGVEVTMPDETKRHRSMVMCECKGCTAERHRTGSIILKEDNNE